MNGDENQATPPVVSAAPAVKRETEVSGGPSTQSEVIKDQEVLRAGVRETTSPAPELAPPVKISGAQIPTPIAPQVVSTIGPPQVAEPEKDRIPEPTLAAQILKTNESKIPLGTQTSEVYRAGVVVHQFRRTKRIERKSTPALPKAA